MNEQQPDLPRFWQWADSVLFALALVIIVELPILLIQHLEGAARVQRLKSLGIGGIALLALSVILQSLCARGYQNGTWLLPVIRRWGLVGVGVGLVVLLFFALSTPETVSVTS